MRIDAHQHFWKFDPIKDAWIKSEMAAIRKDFLPRDLILNLKNHLFDGCIAVQADPSEKETRFLIDLARDHDFIRGVVGWVDLQAADLYDKLVHYKGLGIVKGFRHLLQNERDRGFMLDPLFKRGIAFLSPLDFTYDLLIQPDQLPYARSLVAALPEQKFVIDHMAKPRIRERWIKAWSKDMKPLGDFQNVFCKISGLVTEADWHQWNRDAIYPFLDVIVETFGCDRLLFGSDWPVCLLAASYGETVNLVEQYFSSFTKEEKEKIFGKNAMRFYNI